METETCPHCLLEVPDGAKVCGHCGATRKSVATKKWLTAREGRRNDIMLGGIGLLLVLFVLTFVFTTAYAVLGPKSTSTYCDPVKYPITCG